RRGNAGERGWLRDGWPFRPLRPPHAAFPSRMPRRLCRPRHDARLIQSRCMLDFDPRRRLGSLVACDPRSRHDVLPVRRRPAYVAGMGIEVGVYLPQVGYTWEELRARVVLCDELGIDAVWFMD